MPMSQIGHSRKLPLACATPNIDTGPNHTDVMKFMDFCKAAKQTALTAWCQLGKRPTGG